MNTLLSLYDELLDWSRDEIKLYGGILVGFVVCFLTALLWPFGGDFVTVFGWCASIATIGAFLICARLAYVNRRRD
jgi:hypothetical protein